MPTLATTLADRPADLIRDLLHRALAQFVVDGTLRVTFADGRIEAYGNGTPTAHIALRDRGAELGLLLHPELRLGEAYMDGTLEVVAGDTYDLLRLVLANRNRGRLPAPIRTLSGLASRLRPDRLNDALRSRRNVAHHYDLDGRLYDLFLDADLRQYSCAYFERPDMGLAAAQRAKIARIARKLRASPGQTALDIGCGWGGMATHLARAEGLRVTGITLSDEQLAGARDRVAAAGLADRVDIRLEDYRDTRGPFDRIVSVGMAEHVGLKALGTYFQRIHDLLAQHGVALVHFISRHDAPTPQNPWLTKYIFPGGYTPPLSQALAAVERSGLIVADIEIWRGHYAETLRHWRDRFLANRDRAAALYDERFCRMWDFYLAGARASFTEGENIVAQLLLIRDRDALPETRGWMETHGEATAD